MNKLLFVVLFSFFVVFIGAQYWNPYTYGGNYSPYNYYGGGSGFGYGYGDSLGPYNRNQQDDNKYLYYGFLFLFALWALNISTFTG